MRVLIVSPHPLTDQDPGSVTFASLFSAFQKHEIRQIVIGSPVTEPDLVEAWRVVGPANVRIEKLVRTVTRYGGSHNVTVGVVRDAVKANTGKQLLLSAYADAMPVFFSKEEADWVRGFAPQVVYSTLGSIRCLKTVMWVNRLLNVPIVVHYMDDWIATQYRGPFTWIPRRMLLHLNKKVVDRAAHRLAISPHMARQYEIQFARPFDNFMHCVDIPSESRRHQSDGELRMAYVGGLHLFREEVLARLGSVIQARGGKIGHAEVSVDCYAPESHLAAYRDRLEGAGVCCVRSLQPHEVADVIAGYDCLIHVESFDQRAYRYTRLSISTKIPVYLAAGLPILAIGPRHQAAVEYVCTNGAGVGIYDLSEASISSALEVMANRSRKEEMGRNARNLALTNHDRSSESVRFRGVMEHASGAWNRAHSR